MRHVIRLMLLSLVSMVFTDVLLPDPAYAIPAFARKYEAPCGLCHYPAVPRLNSLGHRFRIAGYRMANEFGESQEIATVGRFLSVRGRGRYEFVGSKLEATPASSSDMIQHSFMPVR